MKSKKDWETCKTELRSLIYSRDGSVSTNMKTVADLTSYMDEHYKTQFNLTVVEAGKWVGSSCKDCDDYECSESQFASCEMGSVFKEGCFSRNGEIIEYSKVLKLLTE